MELINKYTIYKPEIGSGAYSKVYKALDKNGNLIAIKKINIENINQKLLERIEYEIHIHKKLDHPNIVKLYDVFRNEKCICLILEFCDKDFDNIKYNMTVTEIKINIIQLNNALKYLKEHNIIHRDLKPKNILLLGNTIKLADFGFASDKTIDMYNTVCGSPLYMAPEIINIFIGMSNEVNNKSVYDSKCDIWSLGLIIYECYFKFHPFKNSINIVELYKNIKNNNISFIPITNNNYNEHDKIINLLKLMLVCDDKNRISWTQYFNHDWFNNDKNDNIIPISIPITNPISIPIPINNCGYCDNIIKSLPCINNQHTCYKNSNYDDIDNLLKDDFDDYYKNNSDSNDDYNNFVIDLDTNTNTDTNTNRESDGNDRTNRTNRTNRTDKGDSDYIIINENDLLLFDTDDYNVNNSITNNVYNFLSSSVDRLKNHIRYFTY
jgi:serine/threonine protein kinase